MSETIKFWEAMKHFEEGKDVEYLYHTGTSWCALEYRSTFEMGSIEKYQWRIKPVPVKYSVDIWVDRELKRHNEYDELSNYLFGINETWDIVKTDKCNRHYRMKVEEVVE